MADRNPTDNIRLQEAQAEQGDAIVALFVRTFEASEGPDEGQLVGKLAKDLIQTTPTSDLPVFTASDNTDIVGAIMFSRLTYDQDPRAVVLLSPVAVQTGRQGQGIGQRLIDYGVAQMGRRGADVVLTYGDPAYYGRVGFRPLTTADASPPFPLSRPHGWQGRGTDGLAISPLLGPSRTVPALARVEYW